MRVPGADVNSYLALSAIVAAGRRGVALALEPTAPARGNAWDNDAPRGAPFPLALAAALGGWRNSALARETFGAEFVPEFAASRDWQLTQFARAVTDGEVRQFAEGVCAPRVEFERQGTPCEDSRGGVLFRTVGKEI